MAQSERTINWDALLKAAGPYPIEAFCFVREGLNYTANRIHGADESMDELDRHISGQDLCLGLRDFAIERYGLLAPLVLNSWHIARTEDFGRIVYAMIDFELMSQTPDDSEEDFRAVYDFDEAFSDEELFVRIGAA